MASNDEVNGHRGDDDFVKPPKLRMSSYSRETRALHADGFLEKADVAPAMHVSTTFSYTNDPDRLIPIADDPTFKNTDASVESHYYYSRFTTPNTTRLEAILSSLLHGRALTYSSGLSAFHGMLVYFNPKRIAIGGGYHGCHGVISIISKLTGLKKVDLFDESKWDAEGLGQGDIVHIESPLNPTGEAMDIAKFAAAAHNRGAIVTVDATFGPPGLQNPFEQGADVVMHSGTKYFGGHSDLLCGVLATKRQDWWMGLWRERSLLGTVMGSLEGWLGLRSMRTLELRVQRQSETAEKLVKWLTCQSEEGTTKEEEAVIEKTVFKVQHASLQIDDMEWLLKQMPNGFGPVFALWMKTPKMAKTWPSKLELCHHATSLGGVETLVEWRRMSDSQVDERVLRISVGVESFEDLKRDFLQGFEALI